MTIIKIILTYIKFKKHVKGVADFGIMYIIIYSFPTFRPSLRLNIGDFTEEWRELVEIESVWAVRNGLVGLIDVLGHDDCLIAEVRHGLAAAVPGGGDGAHRSRDE
jgi:hypothetical protein